ncbi:hypothetical protein, partial [Azospirillum endophyticum]|uniref:hypothetical protein n=1 Tax=Azospirillum endophyticum TaxID=2800326 RepID=UPI001B3BB458
MVSHLRGCVAQENCEKSIRRSTKRNNFRLIDCNHHQAFLMIWALPTGSDLDFAHLCGEADGLNEAVEQG